MAISLSKGQKISLSKELVEKEGSKSLSKILVGLGWDASEQRGGPLGMFNKSIDCDASAILCGSDGKVLPGGINKCCVYFAHLRYGTGEIVHMGDNLTGGSEGDDEQIKVNLTKISHEVNKVVFVVNIYRGLSKKQHFGMISNAYIRIVNLEDEKEICRYNLTDDYEGKTGMIVGELIRNGEEWDFNAVGQGVDRANDVNAIIKLYS